MAKSKSFHQTLSENINEYIEKGYNTPDYVFVDVLSFKRLLLEIESVHRYDSRYKYKGLSEVQFYHSMGTTTVVEVIQNEKLLFIGTKDQFLMQQAENILLR